MRFVSRCVPVVALVLGLGAARAEAQTPAAQRSDNFAFYIGGYGGILNFGTPAQTRATVPLGGAQLIVKAKRTGLLLQVDQGFGSNEATAYQLTTTDPNGAVTGQGTVNLTFNYVRKYTAALIAFPIRAPVSPYFGIGVGLYETGGYGSQTTSNERSLGSNGFGTLIGGIQIQYSRVTAFGQYQVTSATPSDKSEQVQFTDGSAAFYQGALLRGVTHTLTAGLRFNLGRSKESFGNTGGY